MVGDRKNGEDVGVNGNGGASGCKQGRSSEFEDNAIGASSDGDDAAQGRDEDTQEQVITVPQTTASKPCAQHFARDASTCVCSCSFGLAPQVSDDHWLQKAETMLTEGIGAPKAFVRDGPAADITNGLLDNGQLAETHRAFED